MERDPDGESPRFSFEEQPWVRQIRSVRFHADDEVNSELQDWVISNRVAFGIDTPEPPDFIFPATEAMVLERRLMDERDPEEIVLKQLRINELWDQFSKLRGEE